MRTKELIDSAVEHLRTSAGVKTVYGDPVTVNGKTVIPVAKVAFGFGEGKKADEGEGAGGGISAKPVGVVEISGQDTRFVPIGQVKKMALVGLIGSGIGLGLGLLFGRRFGRN